MGMLWTETTPKTVFKSFSNKKSDIKKINLLVKSLTVNHKLNLKEIKGRISFSNNEFSEVIFFENEGHGFKNIENKKVVMQKSKEFLKNALNI